LIFCRYAKDLHHQKQIWWAKLFTAAIITCIMLWMGVKASLGQFDWSEDLPFHLCNFLPFATLYVLLTGNSRFFGILYFFIMAGTLQAIITPDLKESFPHFIYFRFWIVHCGLVMLVCYFLFVLKWEIRKSDIPAAWITANLYLLFSIIINLITGGNYFFSMRKPETASLLDYLGPWPWYLLTGQVAMLLFFVLLYQPVNWLQKKSLVTGNN
jgi:hypothetical integral membrane protein (TIGR02206 family)